VKFFEENVMRTVPLLIIAGILCVAPVRTNAQGRGRGGDAAAARSPKDAAPTDLTGYWVSIVTEDWRFRMITPKKGDYASVPLNAEGRKVADTWDPDKDTAAGEQCRSYGAAAIMRVPGRLHITWADDNTLRIDTDAGTQTRMLHFGKAQPQGSPSWQGDSAAQWDIPDTGRGAQREGQQPGGSLKVITTHLRPGYLRKNGVPYSGNTVLTEYFSHTKEPNGDEWLIVTTIVEDPQYLMQPFITSTHFKRIPDASGWNPTPCVAK
jgi:hypothetical protein